MTAEVIDLHGVRISRAYRQAAELEQDMDYAAKLESMAVLFERKGLTGGGRLQPPPIRS